jgi:hypothetical protein
MKTLMVLGLALGGMLTFCSRSYGLAEERVGPDSSAVAQPDWPKGIVELARHPSRVYSIWVNGNEQFYFKAGPDEIKELVEFFSRTRIRDHVIHVEPSTNSVKSLSGSEHEYNVSLHIRGGIARLMAQREGAKEVSDPTLTISSAPMVRR